MKLEKLHFPYLWRYLAREAFHRRHPRTPAMVGNAVIALDSWLRPEDRGLEWGSGRSTLWFASRVAHLVTIEHDSAWFAKVGSELAARNLAHKVDYRLIEAPGDQMSEPAGHPYAAVADQFEDAVFDFIVVDGQMRRRCIEKALTKLKPGALLVLDGANRYLPNRFEDAFTTIRHTRSTALNQEWRDVADRLRSWRAMNTSDGLWDTRLWVKPA